jgi:hypothetical protein
MTNTNDKPLDPIDPNEFLAWWDVQADKLARDQTARGPSSPLDPPPGKSDRPAASRTSPKNKKKCPPKGE